MRFSLWLVVFALVVHATLVQSQLLSRLLNHFLFKSRHSEEDDHPRYPRRRPPPRRRYHRRPSDPSDPFKYDPDDEDYHKEHALPRPPRRPAPSHRRAHPPYFPAHAHHKSNEQDGDDTNPPMTIYLQPGANGDFNKPRRIRVVTLDSYPPFGYGHNNPYQASPWNKGLIQRDLIFPQNHYSKRGPEIYVTYGARGPPEPLVGHIINGFGTADGAGNAIDSYGVGANRGGSGSGAGGAAIMVPDPGYHPVSSGYAPAGQHGGNAGGGGGGGDAHVQSTTTAAKFDYDYYRKKRKK